VTTRHRCLVLKVAWDVIPRLLSRPILRLHMARNPPISALSFLEVLVGSFSGEPTLQSDCWRSVGRAVPPKAKNPKTLDFILMWGKLAVPVKRHSWRTTGAVHGGR